MSNQGFNIRQITNLSNIFTVDDDYSFRLKAGAYSISASIAIEQTQYAMRVISLSDDTVSIATRRNTMLSIFSVPADDTAYRVEYFNEAEKQWRAIQTLDDGEWSVLIFKFPTDS